MNSDSPPHGPKHPKDPMRQRFPNHLFLFHPHFSICNGPRDVGFQFFRPKLREFEVVIKRIKFRTGFSKLTKLHVMLCTVLTECDEIQIECTQNTYRGYIRFTLYT